MAFLLTHAHMYPVTLLDVVLGLVFFVALVWAIRDGNRWVTRRDR